MQNVDGLVFFKLIEEALLCCPSLQQGFTVESFGYAFGFTSCVSEILCRISQRYDRLAIESWTTATNRQGGGAGRVADRVAKAQESFLRRKCVEWQIVQNTVRN